MYTLSPQQSQQQVTSGKVQFLPGLASNWTVSPDGSKYIFNLRQNITFSNGDPFNAYQVWLEMYGFYYLSANTTGWLESYAVFNMSNANFGPSTISMIANNGGVVNPSPLALQTMMNSSWPIYVTGPIRLSFNL